MATLRTYEEKAAIVSHCIELEQTGGDILGYLWSENYISPRATWCNFQREWLHRKPYEYTDGKPKKKGEIRLKSKFVVTPEIRDEAVRIAINGGDPRNYLTGMGSQNGMSAWTKIRMDLKKNSPEIYAQLPKRIGNAEVPESPETPTLKVDGPLKIETPEANKVTVAEVPEKPKITQPLMHSGKKAIGWEGDFGNYIYDRKHQYIDYESNDGEEISMPVQAWREWLKEIREIAQLMGVEL